MIDDDAAAKSPAEGGLLPRRLEGLGVGDMEVYIRELEGEILRVRAAIETRRKSWGGAEALFGRPGGASPGGA